MHIFTKNFLWAIVCAEWFICVNISKAYAKALIGVFEKTGGQCNCYVVSKGKSGTKLRIWDRKESDHSLCKLYFMWKWKSLSRMDSFWPHGLYSPWNSSGHNTGVGSLSLLQGIFPTQGLNPGLPHCRQILYQLSHKGCPCFMWSII